MTLGDFIKRLQGMIDGKGIYQSSTRSAQVKLAKSPDNLSDLFDYFEVKKVGSDIVLVPTQIWSESERRKSNESKL